MQEKDALYTEAERAYRDYFAEDERLYRAGAPASDRLLSLVSPEVAELSRSAHPEGTRYVGGEFILARVTRLPGVSKSGSIVALETCEDTSNVDITKNGKSAGRGGVGLQRIYFGRSSGSLKIVDIESKQVDKC